MEGRYVNVVIPGDSKNLTLCEVKVYGTDNVKLNGNSDQSSIFQYWNAERAVDGKKLAQGAASICTQTKEEKNPWWRLDLLDIYYVSAVTITNRIDSSPELINGAEIRIGNSLDSDGNKNPSCAVIQSIPGVVSYNYSFPQMEGRFVNVIIPGDKKILTLCEVEVYGILTVRKAFVRMKFVSTSDPENDKLLYQLQSALAFRGITDVKLSWIKLPQREQKRDVEEGDEVKRHHDIQRGKAGRHSALQ
ncbi:Fucolectin-4 [Anabarilius grahami]|uniref:Fucolectin-4 n=1 Tax=Anabarilius grahami TaxID=495550 RepID=A0A3N0Y434_ANAGA|nr:Fucolectin-4 [Anabarilius grahami]